MTIVPPCAGLGLAVAVAVAVLVAVAVFVGVAELAEVCVGVGEAVGVITTPQGAAAVAMFLGTGAVTTSKSLLLLSVSWQPFSLRTPPCDEVSETPLLTDGLPPSPVPGAPLPPVPYAAQSTKRAS